MWSAAGTPRRRRQSWQTRAAAHLDLNEPSLTVVDRPMWHGSGTPQAFATGRRRAVPHSVGTVQRHPPMLRLRLVSDHQLSCWQRVQTYTLRASGSGIRLVFGCRRKPGQLPPRRSSMTCEERFRSIAVATHRSKHESNAQNSMNNSPTKNFHVLLDHISLSTSEKEMALSRAESVCENLKDFLLVRECIVTGSMARSTAIRTFSDVDIIAVIKNDPEMTENSNLAINAISNFLSRMYGNIEDFDSAVHIALPDEPGIDVVPALLAGKNPSGHSLFKIPAERQAWINYDPAGQNKRIEELSQKLGDESKRAIRLAKWWSRVNGSPIPSYEIEGIASRTFLQWSEMPPPPEALAAFLKEAATNTPKKVTDQGKILVREAALIAQEALELAKQGDTAGSVDRWRCLLGEQFSTVVF
ncbi:nucleotidyltransferase domain-containing protein [Streptomyces phaeochromogenes]|uniref:SMODS domain-containing nucleotidyltransferase n=1 Tax=Streptomyces phaeochromogenes TaxID=1923 RepID=UPI0033CD3441